MKAFTAPRNMLSLIRSRWPRKRSQNPAGEMWSVVVFPLVLKRSGISTKSASTIGSNACSSCSRSLSFATFSSMRSGSSDGGTNPSRERTNPLSGISGAFFGGRSVHGPSLPGSVSASGLNDSRPDSPYAMVISGLPMKARVSGLASFLPGKLRLNDVTMVLRCPFLISSRRHCPMHGPQAFARTVAPTDSRAAICRSRLMVSKIWLLPGVTRSGTAIFAPCSLACSATSAAREMSS